MRFWLMKKKWSDSFVLKVDGDTDFYETPVVHNPFTSGRYFFPVAHFIAIQVMPNTKKLLVFF